MFNKEGVPFFIIIIPFLSVIFLSFFASSFYLKLSHESKIALEKNIISSSLTQEEKSKKLKSIHENEEDRFLHFLIILTISIMLFMVLFSLLMNVIVSDIIKNYKAKVKSKESSLKELNHTLEKKVQDGIKEAKAKDKAILEQSKLARMGSTISMIAHQWRQPLSELSGVLMELETAVRFKKADDEYVLNCVQKSDNMIEFMSNTIDDFRNFYKPDKVKEKFSIESSCKKALNLVSASLANQNIEFSLSVQKDSIVYGYPTEYAQALLNIMTNAKDVLSEKKVKNPKIELIIQSKNKKNRVYIKDNAGGIPEEYFEMLFDPYFSTKDSSKGTGLGLYISKIIVENNMNGELHVYNDKHGAVFEVVMDEIK